MPDQPNVLFILTDQHRLEAVGCYANTVCQTPNIDRLACEGVQFENAYTTAPLCSPARASILTGQYPHAHGVTDNVGCLGCSVHTVTDRPEMLSRQLEAAGYTCGYNGKWHLSPNLQDAEGETGNECPPDVAPEAIPAERVFGYPIDAHQPSDLGFEGFDFPGHGGGGWEYPSFESYLSENGYELEIDHIDGYGSGGTVNRTEATVPYFLTERTLSLLEDVRGRDDPFFIWHNFWGPHAPYYPSREFYEPYANVDIPPWPNASWPAQNIPGTHHCKTLPERGTMEWGEWAEAIRHYYAFTTMIDAQIGRLLDYLEDTGLLESTVVVFAADHGETIGSHGGLTDKGFHHFEEIMHIPMIARFPDGQWAGTAPSELVSLVDLYPTFLDCAGVSVPPDRHGRSLCELLESDGEDWRDAVAMEFHGLGNEAHSQRTLRMGDLKYGYNAGLQDELYDLSIDPHETQNLIDHPDYQDDVDRLRDRLSRWQAETDDPL